MEHESNAPPLTPQEFAHLGAGAVPGAPQLRPGVRLHVLIGADGWPLMLTDTTSDATRVAWEHDLETVTLH